MILKFGILLLSLSVNFAISDVDTDYNTLNSDGSYSFGSTNDDIGSYYHNARGSPNNVIRGRYGSRSPVDGRIEETSYSAGPRGFRARGPNIHRKMDLSQIPRGPIGTIDDPLADPYEDPSYGFGFRTSEYERREDADDAGRVRGLYSFLDDIGERHTVRYAAGANTGFEVLNGVPDSSAFVHYSTPLYKTNRAARGRISYERGPGRQYKFISSGPDQRRSESIGSDGITRGSYSYLDDKGIQRTVQYIAGAGIGYRVIQNKIGSGTHLLPTPAIPEFTAPVPAFTSNRRSDDESTDFRSGSTDSMKSLSKTDISDTEITIKEVNSNSEKAFIDRSQTKIVNPTNDDKFRKSGLRYFGTNSNEQGSTNSNKSGRPNKSDNDASSFEKNEKPSPVFSKTYNRGKVRYSSNADTSITGSDDSSFNYGKQYNDGNTENKLPPFINTPLVIETDRKRDWALNGRDSTVVKNVGDWYVGLPPGTAVRAHVQNIDLLPLGGRPPSPSEALLEDERRSRFLRNNYY